MCRATAANRQNFPYFVIFCCSLVFVTLTCLFFPNNRRECWILRSADVWTIHSSFSLETFNNPYAPLGVTWDETRWVLCSLEGTEKQNNIVSLKCCSLAFLDFIYLLACLPFFAHCHPPWFRLVCLPTLASSKHCQRFNVRGRERMRDSERGREEQVPGCFVGNAVKRGTMHGTRRPFSRAHFKACFALVLSTFGRGEERSEGGAAFEQRWVFTHCLSCRCSL